MKVVAVPGLVILVSAMFCLFAGLASAQSASSTTDSAQSAQAAAPLQLQVPPQPVVEESPAETSDNAIVDAQDGAASERGSAPEVHGSVTTGIGWSSGYGTTTFEAAEFDVSGQSDSGRHYGVHIEVQQSKGPGYGPRGGYYPVR